MRKTGVRYTAFLIVALVLIPSALYAAETSVTNTVSVSASTGGNSADSGEVIEGEARADVFVETIVDGQVIEHIEKSVASSEGEPVIIEENSSYESQDGDTKVEAQVKVNIEESSNNNGKTTNNQEDDSQEDSSQESSGPAGGAVSSLLAFLQKILDYVFSLFT